MDGARRADGAAGGEGITSGLGRSKSLALGGEVLIGGSRFLVGDGLTGRYPAVQPGWSSRGGGESDCQIVQTGGLWRIAGVMAMLFLPPLSVVQEEKAGF